MDDWSHEQLNVLDGLNRGDANQLVKYVVDGGTLNETLVLKLRQMINSGDFGWKQTNPKVGRPVFSIWDDWACIGLVRQKGFLIQKYPEKRIIDIEEILSKEAGINIDDLRLRIKDGIYLLKYFADEKGEDWAKALIKNAKKQGKNKKI